MRPKIVRWSMFALVIALLGVVNASGHEPGQEPDGHVPPDINYGFEVVAHHTLAGVIPSRYTDVWEWNGFAYVGSYELPECDRSGVFITDIRDPANPVLIQEIPSPPFTRVNDVKVHFVNGRDVLIFTLEPCGQIRGNIHSSLNAQQGKAGISLWDVTDPFSPHALKQNFFNSPIHNTFPWTTEDGKTYLLLSDLLTVNDTHVVDISKPQTPKVIATTGVTDWRADPNIPIEEDRQFWVGASQFVFNHDTRVEKVGDKWIALLAYWDAGFITLDVTDPHNPVFLDDSTYPDPDPVHAKRPEGNAHSAVFAGPDSEMIFGADEDFDPGRFVITADGLEYNFNQSANTPALDAANPLAGDAYFLGLGCDPVPPAPSPEAIAVFERGVCAFTTKAQNAQQAGYQVGLVFNNATECDLNFFPLAVADIPILAVPRSDGFRILGIPGYDPATCTGSGSDNGAAVLPPVGTQGAHALTVENVFDGWGYVHVLNNRNETVTVPYGNSGETREAGYLGEIGYYAPIQGIEPEFASGFGFLSAHNLETDPQEPTRVFMSWLALGLRALEWRPGHLHTNAFGEGWLSWNVHEVGRFIPEEGSDFWGIHVTEINGEQYILASDRATGLWILQFTCVGPAAENPALFCVTPYGRG